jgi:hypothetical protein
MQGAHDSVRDRLTHPLRQIKIAPCCSAPSCNLSGLIDRELSLFHLSDVCGDVVGFAAVQRHVGHDGMRQAQKLGQLVEIDVFRVCDGLQRPRLFGLALGPRYGMTWQAPLRRQPPAIFEILSRRRLTCREQANRCEKTSRQTHRPTFPAQSSEALLLRSRAMMPAAICIVAPTAQQTPVKSVKPERTVSSRMMT